MLMCSVNLQGGVVLTKDISFPNLIYQTLQGSFCGAVFLTRYSGKQLFHWLRQKLRELYLDYFILAIQKITFSKFLCHQLSLKSTTTNRSMTLDMQFLIRIFPTLSTTSHNTTFTVTHEGTFHCIISPKKIMLLSDFIFFYPENAEIFANSIFICGAAKKFRYKFWLFSNRLLGPQAVRFRHI